MLRHMSSRELTEWMVYEKLTGPLGPARSDLQAGIIAATIANVNRGKNQKPAKPSDFIPKWDNRPRSDADLWAIAKAMNAVLGGTEVE